MAQPMQHPVFEADQVLTNKHLNDAFNYLDAQNRLTRTHLIGIGIVCGLDLNYNKIDTLTISRGCGVTSLGLLAFFENTTAYKFARKVALPKTFIEQNPLTKQYEFLKPWEISETQQSGDDVLSPTFLDDKVVMLLLEANLLDLKNCDTTDCSDKGKRMDFRLRPLLITITEAEELSRQKNKFSEIKILENRFALPDLYLHRFDVFATNLVNTKDILAAFSKMMDDTTINTVSDNLQEAHNTFKTLLQEDFSADFSILAAKLTQTRDTFQHNITCQYMFDWIDDLVKTYKEIQEIGTECLTVCCPEEALFPYHLLLGRAVISTNDLNNDIKFVPYRHFRHYFIHSPIANCHDALVATIRSLFKRLSLMIQNFGNVQVNTTIGLSQQKVSPIRITPSKFGDVPLSEKAIPYYYKSTPLYQYWNYEKTRRYKADTNLGYRADEYSAKPAVRTPLLFDIEPYNFFRIEGHIGLNFQTALAEIVSQQQQLRLPFNVVALKAKKFDEKDVDYSKIKSSLRDLEISYDIVRREWEAIIGQTIEWLDDNKAKANVAIGAARLRTFIGHLVKAKRFMFDNLPEFIDHYHEFIPLYETIELEADTLANELRLNLENPNEEDDKVFLEDLIDHLDEVGLSIVKGPFRALYQDFQNRVKALLQLQYFEFYAKKHPAIEHKAGVVRGGTFIIVYADSPKQTLRKKVTGNLEEVITPAPEEDFNYFKNSFETRLQSINDPIKRATVMEFFGEDFGKSVIVQQSNIADGIVFADFYLPYLCCADGSGGITYILETPKEIEKPMLALEPIAFCNDIQEIIHPTVSPEGGVLKIDGKVVTDNAFSPNALPVGTHILTYEANGLTSDPITITIHEFRNEQIEIEVSSRQIEPAQSVTFTVINPIVGEVYTWNFGDGTATATGISVLHTFNITASENEKPFVVVVSLQNLPCISSETITEIIVKRNEMPVVFNIEKRIYCWGDKGTYCFDFGTMIVENSKIENPDELKFINDKDSCFIPNDQEFSKDETEKTFKLIYQGIEIEIILIKPDANFLIQFIIIPRANGVVIGQVIDDIPTAKSTANVADISIDIALKANNSTYLDYEWKILPEISIPKIPNPIFSIPSEFGSEIEKNNNELVITLTVRADIEGDNKPCQNSITRIISLAELQRHLKNQDEF